VLRRRHPEPSPGELTATDIAALLSRVDSRPPGDDERGRIQRRVARAVHASPALRDDPALTIDHTRLGVWQRFVPHLLDDEREAEIARSHAPEVGRLVAEVLALDDDRRTSHRSGDDLAAGLDDHDPEARVAADAAARAVTRRRAVITAPLLLELTRLQGADDAERGLINWRSRTALIEGTTAERLDRLVAGVTEATSSVQPWLVWRHALCGASYSDRRVIPNAAQRTLEADTALACTVLSEVSPTLRQLVASVPASVVGGQISECVVDGDRLSVTVAHRGNLRSTLMTAHEIGHAVHALASAGRQPPGVLVGEAIGCLAAVLVADSLTAGPHVAEDEAAGSHRAAALALGDHLIDEIHLSAAASRFENAVHDPASGAVHAAALDDLWLSAIRAVYEPAISVPVEVGTDWARHPSFVASPGHAVSYVWANLFALAVVGRELHDLGDRLAEVMGRGAIDADEFLEHFDIDPDQLLDAGLAAFDERLERLAEIAFR
jgi:hypothetical protein